MANAWFSVRLVQKPVGDVRSPPSGTYFLLIRRFSAAPLRSITPIGLIQGPDFFPVEGFARNASSTLGFRPDPRSRLKPPVNSFKSLKRIQELETSLAHWICRRPKLLGVLDGEFDPINSDATLVCHFEFHRRGLAHTA